MTGKEGGNSSDGKRLMTDGGVPAEARDSNIGEQTELPADAEQAAQNAVQTEETDQDNLQALSMDAEGITREVQNTDEEIITITDEGTIEYDEEALEQIAVPPEAIPDYAISATDLNFDPKDATDDGHAGGWSDPPDSTDDLWNGQEVELYNVREDTYEYGEVDAVDKDDDRVTVTIDDEQTTVATDWITAKEAGPNVTAREASPEEFADNVQQFIDENPEMGAFLTEHPPEELEDHDLIMIEEGDVGCAVSPEGDIQNLFNLSGPEGSGRKVIEEAIERGGNTLDCYDGFLPDLYGDYGFRETGRIEFNRDYAPDGWNYDEYGEPDVVFMSYKPEELSYTETDNYYNEDDWGQAKQDSRGAGSTGQSSRTQRQRIRRRERKTDSRTGENDG